MSFTSKNLQSKKGGLSFIKGATLFFLGMSCILFVTKAFEISPSTINAVQYIQSIFLTNDGSNVGLDTITLNGANGNGAFAGNISANGVVAGDSVQANTVCLNNDPTTPCRTTWPTGGTVVAGGESIWSTGAGGIAYYNSGLVGIGTNTPGYKLDVNGSIRANGSLLVTGGFGGGMYRGNSNIGGNYPYMNFMFGGLFLVGGSGAGGHNIYIVPNAADSSKGMVMTTGGNVGIGTNSPNANVHIYGIEPKILLEGDNNASDGTHNKIIFSDNQFPSGESVIEYNSQDFEFSLKTLPAWPMIFGTNNSERMRISGNGNVGIGTNNPTSKLEVVSGGKISLSPTSGLAIINLNENPSSQSGMSIGQINFFATVWSFIHSQNVRLTLSAGPGLTDQLVMTTGGNVGIGISTPATKLEVNGAVTATAYYYSSDRRLKTDITSITDPLQKILSLNGYDFTWKKNGKKDMGVIAQEVEKVFPNIVNTNAEGYKSVEYGNLVAPLIEAIKELNNKVDAQAKEIEVLKTMIQ